MIKSLSFGLTLGLVACSGGESGVDFLEGVEPIEVGSATSFYAANDDGKLTITGEADRTEVEIDVSCAGGTDEDYGQVSFVAESRDTQIYVALDVPDSLSEVACDVNVKVPAGLTYEIANGAGDITLSGLTGGGEVATGAGKITGTGLAGSLEIATASGAIDIATTVATGDSIEIGAASGPITLRLPADTNADLAAATQSGTVTVEGLEFDGFAFGGAATGTIGSGGASIDLATGNGDISVIGS